VTTLYLLGGLALIAVAAVWLAIREGRRSGRAETRAEEAQHAVENAERITAAVESAPRTVGDVADRVRRGGRL
jgi:CHASE3 domain sensor protein